MSENAITKIFAGLKRQGPGDTAFSRHILSLLPPLPPHPRIVDIGCGAGAGTLLLAEYCRAPVTAVDIARTLLDQLQAAANARGLGDLVTIQQADMADLGWPDRSVDLLWAEGSAFIMTFAKALSAWRPLLAPNGIAVISELSWFADDPPAEAKAFWAEAYPAMASERENIDKALTAGFEVLDTHRLPSKAWTENYYQPLERRIQSIGSNTDAKTAEVIQGLEKEIDVFDKYNQSYGYSFYLLRSPR